MHDQTRVIGTGQAPQDVVETRVMAPVEAALAAAPEGWGPEGQPGVRPSRRSSAGRPRGRALQDVRRAGAGRDRRARGDR
ncbi:hypothetical protein NKG05_08490 [Oerskovia sp. M15]